MDRAPSVAAERPDVTVVPDSPARSPAVGTVARTGVSVPGGAPSLVVDGLSVAFQSDGVRRPVLDGLSFALSGGEIGCLLGSSGCGKTT
ncbi:MAG: hypothetical protein ACOYLX_22155, partial [Burkholderiaceae bacterium]